VAALDARKDRWFAAPPVLPKRNSGFPPAAQQNAHSSKNEAIHGTEGIASTAHPRKPTLCNPSYGGGDEVRKRVSRPHRFAAVENTAIDALPSVLATGLLTKLIRARDGEEVTVDGLCKTHVEGREALSKAMRMLVDKAFVVKFKIQRASSEMVEEEGQLVAKRGGSWYTTFTVDSVEFTIEDVGAMLADIYDAGNVKAHRVEPEFLDPKKNGNGWARPDNGNPSVGATCEDTEPWPKGDSRPTYGSPTVGPPTVGDPAAHIRKKTVLTETERENEMPLSGRSPVDGRSPSTSGSREPGPVENGGVAASGKTSSPSPQHDDTSRPTRGQKDGSKKEGRKYAAAEWVQIHAVRALLPPEIREGLPYANSLSDAILTAMAEGRTVQQMGDRIMYRWVNHGWAEKFAAKELNPKRLVGPAVDMVRPLRRGDRFACPDLRCENGANLDTGEVCVKCEMRIADWKTERAREYGQKRPVGANLVPAGAGSFDAALPPQRAVQPSPESRTEQDWRALAAAEEEARRKAECDGRDGMCGNQLAPGQTLCRHCAEDAAEQQYLENAGSRAPF